MEPWSIKIGRVFGTPLAKLLSKTKVRPNTITALTVVFSILAFACFVKGLLWQGAVLFFINFVLDCTDGELARITDTVTEFGYKLDKYTDSFNTLILYFGLWYALFYTTGNWLLGGVCFLSHYLVILYGKLFVKKWEYGTRFRGISSYYHPLDENLLTFGALPLLGASVVFYPISVFLQLLSFVRLHLKSFRVNNWRW